MDIGNRKRNHKVNLMQKKILLQFLSHNPHIFYQKVSVGFNYESQQNFWDDISVTLNAFGPPRKTADLWRKTWMDMRLRYKKSGVDLRQIVEYMKNENVVNVKELLKKTDQLGCSLDKCDKSSDLIASDPLLISSETDDKYDIQKTIEAVCELGMDKLRQKLRFEAKYKNVSFKKPKADNSDCEELFSIEEVTDADTDVTNDFEMKEENSLSGNYDLGYYDSEFEDSQQMRQDQSCGPEISNSASKSRSLNTSASVLEDAFKSGNGTKQNTIGEVLAELRLLNKMNRYSLKVHEEFIGYQKYMMQQTLNVQKEMLEAQNLLAASVKSFVDNIAFNS